MQFRLDLIDQIIENYGIAEYQPGCPSLTSSPLHLVDRHFIKIKTVTEKEKPTQQCEVSHSKTIMQKDDGKRLDMIFQTVPLHYVLNVLRYIMHRKIIE